MDAARCDGRRKGWWLRIDPCRGRPRAGSRSGGASALSISASSPSSSRSPSMSLMLSSSSPKSIAIGSFRPPSRPDESGSDAERPGALPRPPICGGRPRAPGCATPARGACAAGAAALASFFLPSPLFFLPLGLSPSLFLVFLPACSVCASGERGGSHRAG